MSADSQQALGHFDFSGRADKTKAVRDLAISLHGQGARTGRAATGIQFYPKQPERIHTKAQRALGEARVVAQHEALAPFFSLVMGRVGVVPKITVDIEVTGLKRQVAIVVELGYGLLSDDAGTDCECDGPGS
ncbi:hypothetical protein D3C87_1227390 [compost metagenome]